MKDKIKKMQIIIIVILLLISIFSTILLVLKHNKKFDYSFDESKLRKVEYFYGNSDPIKYTTINSEILGKERCIESVCVKINRAMYTKEIDTVEFTAEIKALKDLDVDQIDFILLDENKKEVLKLYIDNLSLEKGKSYLKTQKFYGEEITKAKDFKIVIEEG